MKNILEKLDELIEAINLNSIVEKNEYQKFFVDRLQAAGKSISQMTKEEKKEFFTGIKNGWAAEKKKK